MLSPTTSANLGLCAIFVPLSGQILCPKRSTALFYDPEISGYNEESSLKIYALKSSLTVFKSTPDMTSCEAKVCLKS